MELMRVGDVRVSTFQCEGMEHEWSAEEPVGSFAVVLVRSGVFRRRVNGVELLVDRMVGYCELPGSTQQIAHPCGGDTCTAIELSEHELGSLIDPDRFRPGAPLLVAPFIDLAHRLLIKSIRQGADQAELGERATLLAGCLIESEHETPQTARPRRAALYRQLTDRVREALSDDPHLGLTELASMNKVSIFHLSRVFRAVSGTTLSRYRTRLRARLAMDRIANGERNLAHLAADVGFADQAHMTRTLRHETKLTPGRLRSVLVN
jgi:AraC-like DNA-binding protein